MGKIVPFGNFSLLPVSTVSTFKISIFDSQFSILIFLFSIFNFRTSNLIFSFQFSTLEFQFLTFDFRTSNFDFLFFIFELRFSIFNFWTSNFILTHLLTLYTLLSSRSWDNRDLLWPGNINSSKIPPKHSLLKSIQNYTVYSLMISLFSFVQLDFHLKCIEIFTPRQYVKRAKPIFKLFYISFLINILWKFKSFPIKQIFAKFSILLFEYFIKDTVFSKNSNDFILDFWKLRKNLSENLWEINDQNGIRGFDS